MYRARCSVSQARIEDFSRISNEVEHFRDFWPNFQTAG